jgi:4-hydroxybenzoate polyprenyltransferase
VGGGWGTVFLNPLLAALLFAGLAVIHNYTTRVRTDLIQAKRLPVIDAIFLLTIYISSFLFGFFLEDKWDSSNTISMATKISKISHRHSMQLATIMLWVLAITGIAYILYCRSRVKKLPLVNNEKENSEI